MSATVAVAINEPVVVAINEPVAVAISEPVAVAITDFSYRPFQQERRELCHAA
jgi:hypothetical protein